MLTIQSHETAQGTRFTCEDGSGRSASVEALVEVAACVQRSGLSPARVERALVLNQPQGDAELLLAVVYRALQHGRLHEKTTVALPSPQASHALANLLGLEPVAGTQLLACTLDVASFRCFNQATEPVQAGLRAGFAREIVETVERWAPRFFAGPWAQAILQRKLTRAQYVQTLANMHQYVRFTTRLLGRAVAISPTTALRNHFLDHLSGEVNHEIIIERDLKYLGADVEYVVEHRVPNAATRAFMVTEQSMVTFEQHPVLFMACPLAAEGITAHLDQAFLDALRASVASWGYAEPKRAIQFLASHIHTDGGDDGHWQKTVDILGSVLSTDSQQQEFLSVLRLAMDSIEQSFNSNVLELALLGPTAETSATREYSASAGE